MQKKSSPEYALPQTQPRLRGPQKKAADFLLMNERIAGLIPNATRLISLQKTCEKILPGHFAFSEVLQLDKNRLTVGVPNQATAAKLRQKLPELQTGLANAGWPVESIRVRVRIKAKTPPRPVPQKRELPRAAIDELEKLKIRLGDKGEQSPLADAIHTTLDLHR